MSLRRLRIASVYRNFNQSGSIESLFLRNAERLAQDEDVTAFVSAARRAPTSALLRFAAIEPVVHGSGRWLYALECSSFARRASRELARRRAEFDVVHVEGTAAYDADLVTVHAVRQAEVEHYFARVEPHAWIARRRFNGVLRPQTAVVVNIEQRLLGRAPSPYCICPSKAVKRDLERWHGVPSDRIKVLPYGVEVDRFRHDPDARARLRAELGTPPDRLVLLFIGSSFARKGLQVCLDGLARSRSTDAELWVIGGTAAERTRVERATRGSRNRIRLLGRRPPAELPAFYSAADVFVLPSQQDSWALPVTEALAASRVVVASEYAGSSDLIVDGANGYVLEGPGSAGALAALLDGPLADPETRAAVAGRARDAVVPYDYEARYAQYREAHWHAYELATERARRRDDVSAPLQVAHHG
jgi:glycosyltransferase involved in cell wall biosynthesis